MTGSSPAKEPPTKSYFELFPHGADVGVRGVGPTLASAFEQAALALTSAVTDPAGVAAREAVDDQLRSAEDRFLLVDWLNALIYEMAVRRWYFGRFTVEIKVISCMGRPGANRSTARPHAGRRAKRRDLHRTQGREAQRRRLDRAVRSRRLTS